MTMLASIARELVGLFFDDGLLALAVIAVVVVSTIVASVIPGVSAGAVLLAGSLFALFANVMTAS